MLECVNRTMSTQPVASRTVRLDVWTNSLGVGPLADMLAGQQASCVGYRFLTRVANFDLPLIAIGARVRVALSELNSTAVEPQTIA